MARLSLVQRLYWRYLSKPVSERALIQHVIQTPLSSILEIGLGSGARIKQLLQLCTPTDGTTQIRYVGVDAFESAAANVPHMPLKSAHRMLSELGVKAYLIPGEPSNALARVAHTVMPSDLVIIDGLWGGDGSQSRAIADWLPRLCHASSTIFAASVAGGTLEQIDVPASVSTAPLQTKAA
jgi:hypothetical protein